LIRPFDDEDPGARLVAGRIVKEPDAVIHTVIQPGSGRRRRFRDAARRFGSVGQRYVAMRALATGDPLYELLKSASL